MEVDLEEMDMTTDMGEGKVGFFEFFLLICSFFETFFNSKVDMAAAAAAAAAAAVMEENKASF